MLLDLMRSLGFMGYREAAFPNIRVRRYFNRIRPSGGSLASGDTVAGLGPVVISDYVQVSGDTNPTAPVNSTHNNILRARYVLARCQC